MMQVYHSPAKINLFLRILNRRSDGYHNIASLFQTIDVFDTLNMRLTDSDWYTCSDAHLPMDSTNLVVKAVELFRKKTNLEFKIEIHLDKMIPTEAGLGGGSSNAATTLWALNDLLGKPVSINDLSQWSAELGSDIPFFFSLGTAFCTGRGEIVKNMPMPPQAPMWLFKPGKGLSTHQVFSHLNLDSLPARDPESHLKSIYDGLPLYFNDLENTALEIMPTLTEFKLKLIEMGFPDHTMTGSGTAFFCTGKKEETIYPEVKFINRPEGQWYTKDYE